MIGKNWSSQKKKLEKIVLNEEVERVKDEKNSKMDRTLVGLFTTSSDEDENGLSERFSPEEGYSVEGILSLYAEKKRAMGRSITDIKKTVASRSRKDFGVYLYIEQRIGVKNEIIDLF